MSKNSVKISVTLPNSWQQLSSSQLYYVYSLMADNLSIDQIKAYCFFRWTGIKILNPYGSGFEIKQGQTKGYIEAGLVAAAISCLDFLGEMPEYPVRLGCIDGFYAVDATLQVAEFPGWKKSQQADHRFDFEKYLYCDNLYQGYLETQNAELLMQMAQLLYDSPKIKINQPGRISIFFWWASLKSLFSRTFVNFLTPMSSEDVMTGGGSLGRKLQEATNAQIRALTGGDITKHRQVLALDVWTAMWELDAKAKEYNEMKAKYGK